MPGVFGRAWVLLTRNLGIVVPGLVVGALAAVVEAAFASSSFALAANYGWLVTDVTQILAAIVTISYTTGMADAAWRTGRARYSDGTHAFAREGSHVLVAMVVLFALGLVAAVAAPFTLAISIVVYAFLSLYAMPAAVVGERDGIAACADSARLAVRAPLPTLLTALGIVVVAAVMGVVASELAEVPFLGPLISDIVVQSVVAYAVLVVVGEYRELIERKTPA